MEFSKMVDSLYNGASNFFSSVLGEKKTQEPDTEKASYVKKAVNINKTAEHSNFPGAAKGIGIFQKSNSFTQEMRAETKPVYKPLSQSADNIQHAADTANTLRPNHKAAA